MPEAVQRAHDAWEECSVTIESLSRAHCIALAMLESGDDINVIEHHLIAVGVDDQTAAEVADNAMKL